MVEPETGDVGYRWFGRSGEAGLWWLGGVTLLLGEMGLIWPGRAMDMGRSSFLQFLLGGTREMGEMVR